MCKKSLSDGPATGGEEMYIIGKNFTKGTKVMFEEKCNDQVVWSKEADIDQDYFQQVNTLLVLYKSMIQPINISLYIILASVTLNK